MAAGLESRPGVARVEGIGPVTLNRPRTWLSNSKVAVKPVIDLDDQVPVDAYEIPRRLKEAVHLMSPVDWFPFATSTARTVDIDHTAPYVSPDDGGPPGQTGIGQLGPMTRRHHRIKTHSQWQVRQVWPGVYAGRSPHGLPSRPSWSTAATASDWTAGARSRSGPRPPTT